MINIGNKDTSIRQVYTIRTLPWRMSEILRRSSRLDSQSSGTNKNLGKSLTDKMSSEKSKKESKTDPKDRRESSVHSKVVVKDADKNADKEKDSSDQAKTKTNFGQEFGSFKKDIAVMIARLETRITSKFQELDDKFSGTIKEFRDEMKEELKNVHREIDDTNKKVTGISDKVSELVKSVQYHSDQVTENEEMCKDRYKNMQTELNSKVAEMDKKLKLLEKHDRKYNLLFYRFTEEYNENIQETMKESFTQDLKIDEENMYFAHGHRMP